MSKRRRPSARELREAELGRFELPSFAAGMAIGHLETTLRLLDARQARHGSDPYLDRTREEVTAAINEARHWQAMAAVMLEYPYDREED